MWMSWPASVRGSEKPPTVAAVSSAQRNAYHGPTPSEAASPAVPSASSAATTAPSSAKRPTNARS